MLSTITLVLPAKISPFKDLLSMNYCEQCIRPTSSFYLLVSVALRVLVAVIVIIHSFVIDVTPFLAFESVENVVATVNVVVLVV